MMRLGLDTWDGYGPIDFELVEASGLSFVWIRATGAVGKNGKDSQCVASVANVRKTGMAAGVYHVFHHAQDATKSAADCYALADGLGSSLGELPPAIDAEIPGTETFATLPEVAGRMVASLERHVDAFEHRFGCMPILYGYRYWFEALGEAFVKSETIGALAREGLLWIAAYPRLDPYVPTSSDKLPGLPKPFTRALVHQYSAEHSLPVPGVGPNWCPKHPKGSCQLVDRNRFLGTEADWAKLVGAHLAPPTQESSGGIVHPDVPLGRLALDEP